MSQLQPEDKRRWRRLIRVLAIAGGVLLLVASILNAYLLPFYNLPYHVALVLVFMLLVSGFTLEIVAGVLVFRKLP